MEIGRCPACSRPFTASEVTGYGILRSRQAVRGGPLVELACPGCGKRLRLIPHGHGRYALPGEPPPPPVPPEERRPPWARGRGRAEGEPAAPGEVTATPGPEEEADDEGVPYWLRRERAPAPATEAGATEGEEEAMDVAAALSVLGVGPTARREEIEEAFRQRSRVCHPDKVAHLDADFQVLAERKFRRLKQAYDLLTS